MNKYQWKLASFAKGINVEDAVKEFERIEKKFGSLTPENLLKASEPKDSVLHNLFTWEDEKAAHAFRLSEARFLINNVQVIIKSDGEQRQVSVYEIIKADDRRAYKHIRDFTNKDVDQVKAQTVREINSLKQKLSFFTRFNPAIEKLDEAIIALNK